MINVDDIILKLSPIISYSPFGDGKEIINLSNGFLFVDMFVTLFGNATDMSSQSLHDINDNGNLGYEQHIDDWQSKGYIN